MTIRMLSPQSTYLGVYTQLHGANTQIQKDKDDRQDTLTIIIIISFEVCEPSVEDMQETPRRKGSKMKKKFSGVFRKLPAMISKLSRSSKKKQMSSKLLMSQSTKPNKLQIQRYILGIETKCLALQKFILEYVDARLFIVVQKQNQKRTFVILDIELDAKLL